jgi:uncharacterized protein YukE
MADVYQEGPLGWYDLTASYAGPTAAYATEAEAMAGGTAGLTAGQASGGTSTGTSGGLSSGNLLGSETSLLNAMQSSITQGQGLAASGAAGIQGVEGQIGKDQYSQALSSMMTGNFAPNDPSYQWRLEQGQQTVERSAAAKGLLGSGNVLTALTDYAQGAASQEYQAQFARFLSASQNATSQYDEAIKGFAAIAGIGTGLAQTGVSQGQIGLGLGSQSNTAASVGVQQGNLGLQQSMFGYQKALQSGKDQAAADALASYNAKLMPDSSNSYSSSSGDSTSFYTSLPYGNVTTPSAGATTGGDFYGYGSGTGAWSSSSGGSGTFGGDS